MQVSHELAFAKHPDPMWIFHTESLRFVAVNDAALAAYGYSREEFLRLTVNDIRTPENAKEAAAVLAAAATQPDDLEGITEHRRRNGEALMVEFRSTVVLHDGEKCRLVVVRDRTRLARLEEERAALIESEREARRRAESAAQHFRALFESAPGKYVVVTADDYRVVAASNAYLEATFTERDQICGKTLFEVFPASPDHAAADAVRNVRKSLVRVRTTGTPDVMSVQYYPIPHPAGGFETRYWSPVNTPVIGADGAVQYIIHRVEDVTPLVLPQESAEPMRSTASTDLGQEVLLRSLEVKNANVLLQQRDAMLRNAQRLMSMGNWEMELPSGKLTLSDNLFEMFGIEPASFGNTMAALAALVHPEDRAELREQCRRLWDTHGSMDLTHRLVRPDGRIMHVRQVAEVIRSTNGDVVIGVAQDRTCDVVAAQKAAEAFELLRIAGRVGRLGGWRVDADTKSMRCSPETLCILGATAEPPLTLREAIDRYVKSDGQRLQEAVNACLRRGVEFDLPGRIRTLDGRDMWVRAIGEPERDAAGRICGVRGAFQDVSEVVAAREESQALMRRLKDTLQSMSEGFILLDAEFRFTFVNVEAERILQRTRSELLSHCLWEEFPESERLVRSTYEKAMATGTQQHLEMFYAPLKIWVSIRAYPTRAGLGVYFRDVTREHHLQQELLLLQSAVSRQTDILIITEAEPIEAPDGPRIVYVNDAFVRRTGYSREEVLGRSPRLLQGHGTQRSELNRIRHALERWEPVRAELMNYTKSGEEIWLEIDIAPIANAAGRFTHWVAVERDITERKRVEQRAHMSEQRFRLLASATKDVIWDLDLGSGALWCNDAADDILGHDRPQAELGWEDWAGRIHAEDRQRVCERVAALRRGSETHVTQEYRFVAATGEVLDVMDRAFVVPDTQGKAVRIMGTITNVTALKRLEAELRQSQRLDALGQLTGGIAHDFNNLLTVILGNTELLAESLPRQPHLQELAESVVYAATRGAELTSRLLSFARKQALIPKSTSVRSLLQGMYEMIRRTLGQQLDVQLDTGTCSWPALVDAPQLETAILNLCINARDAMPEGGRLTLSARHETVLDDDEHLQVERGDYVVIAVCDTGHGMDSATLHRAFEPFFTTKEPGRGNGLGLSMVYGFVKQSRGHASIRSTPGSGTTVELFLPRGATEPLESRRSVEALPMGTERILLVEDEEVVRCYVEAQLASMGYEVESVGSALDALGRLDRSNFDLLLTDVAMPGGMSGFQLADEVHTRWPHTRVLFTSGYAEASSWPTDRRGRPVQILRKPYRRHELGAMVRSALDRGGPQAAPASEAARLSLNDVGSSTLFSLQSNGPSN